MLLPCLELDDAHVVEHFVGGLHALVAHAHEGELVVVVALGAEDDEDHDGDDAGNSGGDGGAEVGVEKDEGYADLEGH